MKITLRYLPIIVFFAMLVVISSCSGKKRSNESQPKTYLEIEGEKLTQTYCRSCHLLPDPGLLDKASWMRVLPIMRAEMQKNNLQVGNEDWAKLMNYYQNLAPYSVDGTNVNALTDPSDVFSENHSIGDFPLQTYRTTLVEYEPSRQQIVFADASGNIYFFSDTTISEQFRVGNIPIDVLVEKENLEVLGVGNLAPTEQKTGQVIIVDRKAGTQKVIIDSLHRPLHFVKKDFDGNGTADYLISSFGSTLGKVNTGDLSLFFFGDGNFKKKIVKELPGATKTIVDDLNSDGKPDIIGMFSQGQESLIEFTNLGNLNFRERVLLEFHAVHGSNDFIYVDVNGDSHKDIVMTNGDNGDYTQVFKYYHGLRIFLNDSKNNFTEEFFFPINGASKVRAADFDKDGDPDLVVLAMYPNLYSRPQETLVYFENKGDLDFEAYYIEKEPSSKWMLLDVGDVNSDGIDDVIVGSNYMLSVDLPQNYKSNWRHQSWPMKVFLNQHKGKKFKLF